MDALTTPSNWQKVRLGDIAHIFDGTHQTPQYHNYGVAFFSVENIVSDKPVKFISQQDYLTATNQNRPEYNDILLTRIGTIGVSKVVNWNYPFSIYVTLAVIKQSKYFNSYYLHYFIQSNFFQKELKNNSLLQAIPCKINMNELKKCEVILPPLNEQAAIANILSDVDRYLYSLDALILKKESVKKALSFELLSQRKRLKGFNQAWQRVRLGDIAEIKRGVRITKNELDVFGKYPVVSGGVGFLGYTNNFNRYENTITIAQYGTAGYVNFQKNKFWANDICFCVYPNKDVIKNIFLYYFLKVNQNYYMKFQIEMLHLIAFQKIKF
ncbi:restriction endonuclease subunit S [Helicobacter pylori]|uniref:Type I restriction modification DNA specificity domain protein n=1 Tax=Helicobacter pylori GAM260BSi TaxID=1159046 RepID=M3QWB8_HELPX|nr:restriction endonuclease subunit S [Helicobacter pylori]EMH23562.1 type I restriction modification DNA specificity domain protein [Helicobacter pylori GAM260BSi]EMH69642.1 type I restriction modification DNA specificity domain protein [Helicobacter pylori HP260BFii]